jgi:DnaK suppressor protein
MPVTAELTPSRPVTDRPLTAQQRTRIRTRLVSDLQDVRDLEARLRMEVLAGYESRRGSTNDEIDDPEGANTAFEGAQATAMMNQTARHAEEIAHALARLDDGTYGDCSNCGTRIAKGRLEARPSTAFCISCAA